MKQIRLRFKSLEAKTEPKKGEATIIIDYEENGKLKRVGKIFKMDESAENFAFAFLNNLKEKIKNENKEESDDILGGYVSIIIEEKEGGNVAEKIALAVGKIKSKIRDFNKDKSSENYINRLHDVKEIRVKL